MALYFLSIKISSWEFFPLPFNLRSTEHYLCAEHSGRCWNRRWRQDQNELQCLEFYTVKSYFLSFQSLMQVLVVFFGNKAPVLVQGLSTLRFCCLLQKASQAPMEGKKARGWHRWISCADLAVASSLLWIFHFTGN